MVYGRSTPGKKSSYIPQFYTVSDVLTRSRRHLCPSSRPHGTLWPRKLCWSLVCGRRMPGKKSSYIPPFCTVSDVLTCSRRRLCPSLRPWQMFCQLLPHILIPAPPTLIHLVLLVHGPIRPHSPHHLYQRYQFLSTRIQEECISRRSCPSTSTSTATITTTCCYVYVYSLPSSLHTLYLLFNNLRKAMTSQDLHLPFPSSHTHIHIFPPELNHTAEHH